MPLPSNRQQAVAKALYPKGSLPDPPSGGSEVPERGIPLVCWSYALILRPRNSGLNCKTRMSALGQKPEVGPFNIDVRFTPKTDIDLGAIPRSGVAFMSTRCKTGKPSSCKIK